MSMDVEAPQMIARYGSFTRVKYGHPDYQSHEIEKAVPILTQGLVAEKRNHYLIAEHCSEWPSNKRGEA